MKRPTTILGIVESLFSMLHANDIDYCHWKSNEHLDASMRGDTDLDILFNSEERQHVDSLLRTNGFKRCPTPSYRSYPEIVDYVGLDEDCGKIVHLHAHFKLIFGERYLKSFHLPWEKELFATRVHHEDFDVFTTAPEIEIILLVIREALKIRHRDRLRRRARSSMSANGTREFLWLQDRIDRQMASAILRRRFHSDLAAEIDTVLHHGPNWSSMIRIQQLVCEQLADTRRYGPVEAILFRWGRELISRVGNTCNERIGVSPVQRRSLPNQGLVIAFVGSDGAGKSTVTAEIQREFAKKLDVYRFYFGRPKFARKALIRGGRAVKKLWKGQRDTDSGSDAHTNKKPPSTSAESTPSDITSDGRHAADAHQFDYENLRHLVLRGFHVFSALTRRGLLSVTYYCRKSHSIVICDRYPQNDVAGMHDGPSKQCMHDPRSLAGKMLNRVETALYDSVDDYPPDLVFRLLVPPDVAMERTSYVHSRQHLETKYKTIRQLSFGPTTEVVDINTDRPLEEVLLEIKHHIWQRIN